jgi:hypothetical protein
LLTGLELACARADVALDATVLQAMPVSRWVVTRLDCHDRLLEANPKNQRGQTCFIVGANPAPFCESPHYTSETVGLFGGSRLKYKTRKPHRREEYTWQAFDNRQ